MTMSYTFSPPALGWLGGVIQEHTRVSPLDRIGAKGFTQEDHERLVEAGIISPEGQVSAEWLAALKHLAEADAFARVRLASGPVRAERVAYFRGSGPETVVLTSTVEGFRVDTGNTVDAFLLEAASLTGDSNVLTSAFQVELDYWDVLLLAAFIDLHRLGALRALGAEETYDFPPLPAQAIIRRALGEPTNPRSLTGILRTLQGRPLDPTTEAAAERLPALVERGLLVSDDAGYGAADDDLKRLAGHLLIFDGLVQVEAGRMDGEGQMHFAETAFVQAGLHDILRIDTGGGSVTLETVSARLVLGYLQTMLTEPPLALEGEAS